MKKAFALAVSTIVASSMAVSVSFADPGKGRGNDVAAVCKDLVDNGVVSSVGECMGILRADGEPGLCKFVDYLGLLEFFGFKNRGDCVSYLRSL